MDREITDVFIRICRQVLEANRAKIDGDEDIKGIKLEIKLSECQRTPRTVLFDLSHEKDIVGTVSLKEDIENYSFLD